MVMEMTGKSLKSGLLIKALRMIYYCKTLEQLNVASIWICRLLTHPNYADLFNVDDINRLFKMYHLKKWSLKDEQSKSNVNNH